MPQITKENLITEAEKFRRSEEFTEYLGRFNVNYDIVEERCEGLRLDVPICTKDQAGKFAWFCQKFWEDLPDRADIRTSAFFTLCDFAEYHCCGDDVEDYVVNE